MILYRPTLFSFGTRFQYKGTILEFIIVLYHKKRIVFIYIVFDLCIASEVSEGSNYAYTHEDEDDGLKPVRQISLWLNIFKHLRKAVIVF